ncbi:hypothetical protein BGZ57DRAFT_931248 [Hyaloscypha finlandica]|nr:hypothetical protein BGZ57DRAFT_931248 [Hyaloscypha finlandica]
MAALIFFVSVHSHHFEITCSSKPLSSRSLRLAGDTSKLLSMYAIYRRSDITESTLGVYAFGSVPIESPYLQNAVAAAQNSKAVYGDFYYSYTFTNFSWLSHTCRVQILTQDLETNSLQSDEVAFEGTLAHELYHCIKRRLHEYLGLTYGSISHNISKWWIEGMGMYFGSSIYPQRHKDFHTEYPPWIPLYDMIPDAGGSKTMNNYAAKVKKFAVPTTLPGSPFNVQVSPMAWSITELAKTSFKLE